MDKPSQAFVRRILTTKEAAAALGIGYETFRKLRMEGKLPINPVPYCATRYDRKAIEAYLDKASGIQTESTDWDAVFLERLQNRGDVQDEVRR